MRILKPMAVLGFLFLVVIFFNDGFMAADEYWVGITRYIPAQTSDLHHLVGVDDVKSPMQLLPMHLAAQLALRLGLVSPYLQYRFVILLVGLLGFAVLAWSFWRYEKLQEREGFNVGLATWILALYFATPFALTRPMFESLSTPWLAAAAIFALLYDREERLSDLLWGVFFVSTAFLLRPQTGLCALIFLILPALKRRPMQATAALGAGLFFFVLTGLPDLFLRGGFHASLKAVASYNFQHGSDYGRQPLSYYPAVLAAMTFLPFFLVRYDRDFLRTHGRRHRSLWIMLALFVFLHSLFAQKWERFLIPLIPLLAMLVEPYFSWLWARKNQYRWRLKALLSLNGILFAIASFCPPQENLIGLSTYLDGHPVIRNLYRLQGTPEWITDAFILNKQYHFVDASAENLARVEWKDCGNALVSQGPLTTELASRLPDLSSKSAFQVNWVERLAHWLNPARNQRRVDLHLYGCSSL